MMNKTVFSCFLLLAAFCLFSFALQVILIQSVFSSIESNVGGLLSSVSISCDYAPNPDAVLIRLGDANFFCSIVEKQVVDEKFVLPTTMGAVSKQGFA